VNVLVAMQRGTRRATDQVLDDLSATAMTAALRPALAPDAVLSTDGNPSYRGVAASLGIEAGCFVAGYGGPDGVWHVQNVNVYDSRLKGWMGRFHGVATKYPRQLSRLAPVARPLPGFGDLPAIPVSPLQPAYVNS
jgi:hypothetical protein